MKHRYVILSVAVLAIAFFLLKAPWWAWALLVAVWLVAVSYTHLTLPTRDLV